MAFLFGEIMKEKLKNFWKSYIDITKIYKATNARLFASSIAFFVFLAIFPTILLVFAIIPFTPLTEAGVLAFLAKVLPEALDTLTISIIRQLYGNSPAIVSITAVLLVWSSGMGVQGVKSGLNVINGCKEMSNFIVLRLRAILYAIIFAAFIVVVVAGLLFINYIYGMLESYFNFKIELIDLMFNLRFLIQWFISAFILTFIYAWVPDKKTRPRKQWRGALFTGTTWTVFNFAFSFYLSNFSSFNIYGSMATVIISLVWVYTLSMLFMMGGIINVYINEKKRQDLIDKVDKIINS